MGSRKKQISTLGNAGVSYGNVRFWTGERRQGREKGLGIANVVSDPRGSSGTIL